MGKATGGVGGGGVWGVRANEVHVDGCPRGSFPSYSFCRGWERLRKVETKSGDCPVSPEGSGQTRRAEKPPRLPSAEDCPTGPPQATSVEASGVGVGDASSPQTSGRTDPCPLALGPGRGGARSSGRGGPAGRGWARRRPSAAPERGRVAGNGGEPSGARLGSDRPGRGGLPGRPPRRVSRGGSRAGGPSPALALRRGRRGRPPGGVRREPEGPTPLPCRRPRLKRPALGSGPVSALAAPSALPSRASTAGAAASFPTSVPATSCSSGTIHFDSTRGPHARPWGRGPMGPFALLVPGWD